MNDYCKFISKLEESFEELSILEEPQCYDDED